MKLAVKLFPRSLYTTTWTTMTSDSDPYDLRAKYTHFRILVIGRANAGKTTLLQRVCNTTEDPCIFDDDKNLVSVQRPEDDELCFWHFQLAWTYFSGTPFIIDMYRLMCPTLPILARDTRYQSAFRIQEQSQVYLPRFSWIWDGRREAIEGSPVVYKEESKIERSRRSAACYLVSFAISAYTLATDGQFCGERFCFVLNNARPLLPLETVFFETARAGKGLYHPSSFKFQNNILQYLSSRSLPNSMTCWLRSITSI